jgi:WD40 repeat protein
VSLRFSPDGRYLAGGAVAANGLAIWDVPSGRLRQWLAGFGGVGWLPDSSAVLTTRSGTALGASTPDGRLAETIASPVSGAIGIAVSRDGAYVAVAGARDGGIVRRRDQRRTATLPDSAAVAFASDGTVISLDRAGRVTRWQPATGRMIRTIEVPQYGTAGGQSLTVTPDGTVFVQSGKPGEILELTLDGGPRLSLTAFPGTATGLDASADGHTIAVVGLDSVPMLFRFGVDTLPHPQFVGYLAYDPTGRRLATGSSDPLVRIWDPRSGNLTATIPLTDARGGPLGLAYAPDGSLAVRLDNYTTQVFDAGGRLRGTVRLAGGQAAASPVFSPDGALLAVTAVPTGDDDRQDEPGLPDVVVYDARTRTPKARLETPGSVPISLTFTPDGTRLVAAANHTNRTPTITRPAGSTVPLQDGSVWTWRTADLTAIAHRSLPGVSVAEVKTSPDSTLIGLAAHTGRVELLHTDSLTPAGWIGRHPAALSALAFAPDGRTVATASKADVDVVRLWDTSSKALVAELRGQADNITALEFSPDGKTLASASADWTVALTPLDPDDAVRRLCAIAVPNARNDGSTVPALCR